MRGYGFAVMRTEIAVASRVVVVVDELDDPHPGGVGVLPGWHTGGICPKAITKEQSTTTRASRNLIFI